MWTTGHRLSDPKFSEVRAIADELLVDPHSPKDVARVVERLLAGATAFRSYARQRSRDFAAETSWSQVAQPHVDVYARAIGVASRAREPQQAKRFRVAPN